MKNIWLYSSTLLLATTSLYARAEQDEWRAALDRMRVYCMAEVCLGMSIEEVMALPGGHLEMWGVAKGLRNCTGSYGEWDPAYYISKDGVKFDLGFRDFPGSEEVKKRFRVQSISLYIEATREELNELRGQLTIRYGMQNFSKSKIASLDEWRVINQHFDAIVFTGFSPSPKKSLLGLYAKADKYSDWLQAQPACREKRQPLPKL